MTLETLLRGAGGILLIGANAFFVAVEFALTRLRGLDLSAEDLEDPGTARAWELTERLEIHLTACQLGISSSSVLLGVVAEPAITEALVPLGEAVGLSTASVRPVSVVTGVVVLNLVHKIWGEQAPTYLGVERPLEVARVLAPALAVWSRVMSPVVALGDGLAKRTLGLFGVQVTRSWTEAEGSSEGPGEAEGTEQGDGKEATGSRAALVERIADVLAEAPVAKDRRREILQAIRIDDIAVEDIMVPAAEVVWLREGESFAEYGRRIAADGHTRYPVLEDRAGEDTTETGIPRGAVRGILYVPALFRSGASGGTGDWPVPGDPVPVGLLSEGTFLPGDTSVADAVDRLQKEGEELALVVDAGEGDRVLGILTVTDALEVVVGEIADPLDREEPASG